MDKELFDELVLTETVRELVIQAENICGSKVNRTLIYGYTCERRTFHVYLKDLKIYAVVYDNDFTASKPAPKNMRQITVTSNRDFVPDKRVYPERSDFHFCKLLRERGVEIPFTTWSDGDYKLKENGYYGFTLEDNSIGNYYQTKENNNENAKTCI